MNAPLPHTKSDIRADMRERRRTFVCSLEDITRDALEEQLAELLAPYLASAQIVGAYRAVGGEISPDAALERARRLGRTVAYPCFGEDEDRFVFRAGDPDMPGPFRIPQPSPDAPEVRPDLILVPLLAVGNGGMRIGQGKGHFDRVLAQVDGALVCGIGWQMQRLAQDLPTDEWDVPLDLFVSPRGIEDFRS